MKSRIRESHGDRVMMLVIYIVMALVFVVTLYPILFVLSASVSDPSAVATGKMLLIPKGFTIEGYQYVFQYREIWIGYANTIFYTFFGTLINLVVTLPAAYALSRRELAGRGFFMTLFLITMYFSGGLIPQYLNVNSLGLVNTRTYILIHGAVSVYNLIVARTFFSTTIPEELVEAARIDGLNELQVFTKTVLPLSKPIIVVLALYYGVSRWNSYFTEMIYLSRVREAWPLQLFLREILVQGKFAETAVMAGNMLDAEEMAFLLKQAETANMIKYCVIVISTAPMLIIYPRLQKFFNKGIMIGAVKG